MSLLRFLVEVEEGKRHSNQSCLSFSLSLSLHSLPSRSRRVAENRTTRFRCLTWEEQVVKGIKGASTGGRLNESFNVE